MELRSSAFMHGANDAEPQSSALHAVPVTSALVVEPILTDALLATTTLEACGFHVTIAETFAKGKDRLNARVPDVLVAAIRLAEYNGLQLVLRAKALRSDVAAIVVSPVFDPVLQADSEAMGATFVVKPVAEKDFSAAVFRTIFREKTGTREPLRPPFERRIVERRISASAEVVPFERRRVDRRRDLPTLLRVVARRR
jgi:DNA-binding response OmpR family regulator